MQILQFVVSIPLYLFVHSYPEDLSCGQPLELGETIMSRLTKTDNTRFPILHRGSESLANGSRYYPGEDLKLSVSSAGGVNFIFENQNGAFIGWVCNGRRLINTSPATITMPTNDANITIWLGYATSYGPVSISDKFVLQPSHLGGGNNFPPPSGAPSSASYIDESGLKRNLLLGISLGGFSALAVLVMFTQDATKLRSSKALWSCMCSVAGCALAILCVALVSAWATENTNIASSKGTDSLGFLGAPRWSSNALAWHVVLAVAGFYVSQVFAVTAWSVLARSRVAAKVFHVLFQSAALVTLIVSIVAIAKDKKDSREYNLVTMHSWIGVSCIALFGVNYAFGGVMALLSACGTSNIMTLAAFRSIHGIIGLAAFGVTTVTVLTGISNQLGQETCSYLGYPSGRDVNPARHYTDLPYACKIANGLGVAVLSGTISVFISVWLRLRARDGETRESVPRNSQTQVPLAAIPQDIGIYSK